MKSKKQDQSKWSIEICRTNLSKIKCNIDFLLTCNSLIPTFARMKLAVMQQVSRQIIDAVLKNQTSKKENHFKENQEKTGT